MKIIITIFVSIFALWLLWASLSTGYLKDLRQMNPDYINPNKNLAFLISKLNPSSKNGIWDSLHVKNCSQFMPNWQKAAECVKARIYCESETSKKEHNLPNFIGSEVYDACVLQNEPTVGPHEWLWSSRKFWRRFVVTSAFWITGGLDEKHYHEWDQKNGWWASYFIKWREDAE